MTLTHVTRRQVLQGGTALSGGLLLGFNLAGCDGKPAAVVQGPPRHVPLNAWLHIGTDDTVRFLCDRAEMGQGVYTALPMLLAEELMVKVDRIQVEFAPAGQAYVNDLLGTQITGGSTSIRDAWQKLRTAGAQAREMLIAAACRQWGIGTGGVRVEDGVVVSPRGKRLSYGAVADAAAKLPVPEKPPRRARVSYKVIGQERGRLDTPAKVDGSAVFGIDVKLDGMLYAALAQPPVLGGKLRAFDAGKAKAMRGVRDVIATSSGVVVIADSWWRARRARDALTIQWDPGRNAALNNAAILQGLRKASSNTGQVARNDGDALAALAAPAKGERVLRADYELPLLAHATLEPQNCTAVVTADSCEIYVPTQVQLAAQAAAANAAGLKPEQVRVHTTFLGGGFGRRLEVDFIPAAVEAAKAVGKPVKLVWTREDDMTHDYYRPPAFDRAAALLGADGKPRAWHLHLTSPSVTARAFPSALANGAVDPFAIEAAVNYPYDVPNVRVTYQPHEIGIDVGYWRSVSHALNCFVAESFMDELAVAAGQDPLEYRLALLEKKQPRYWAVLRAAAREARYGQLAKGHRHGVAVMEGYGTYMAQIADCSIENGKLRVHHIYCAVDCGQAVHPNNIVAQVESSIIFGLSAALWGQIDIAAGRVQQTNFDRYRTLRLPEIPKITTYLTDSAEPPGGIGEPATALVAPAVGNALYMLTGKRVRSLPFARHGYA